MNELIKELALQAGWDNHHSKFDTRIEKLAELIVRECMDVVAKKCASPTAYNALAEHFGVEE